MQSLASSLVFAFLATSVTAADPSCCFGLTASGGPGGPIGQLSDGQNRIGQNLPVGKYCINGGGLTDGSNRGCILTSPTTQFQCDVGAAPQTGFDIGCDGSVTYQGSTQFWACSTGDNGGYNIYTSSTEGQVGCVPINLTADSCHSKCASTLSAAKANSCPTELSGSFEFPHLIVQVDTSKPDSASGTLYDGEISPKLATIFNFDVSPSHAGQTCSLVFLFPEQSELTTSSYTLTGSGLVDFSQLGSPATQSTTYNNAPKMIKDYGLQKLAPGNSYTIATFPCPAGQTVAYKLTSYSGTNLTYFQDSNPKPIGLYITTC